MSVALFPAIDLRRGRVVRLERGAADAETVYGDDPVEVARGFVDAGARWLHMVNLDGAFGDGAGVANREAIKAVIEARLPIKIQLGGGLRTLDDIEATLEMGCARVILGSVAVEAPEIVARAVARFGDARVVVGLDSLGDPETGEIRVRGWTAGGAISAMALAHEMVALGARHFLYTDITRDGMLTGPDSDGAARIAAAVAASVLVSGGVGHLDHLKEARRAAEAARPGFIEGVIVGKALYEKRFTVEAAIETLEG